MNFSTFTKISSGNLIYFRNESPIENVGTLKFYKDNSSGTFLKKEFRWSFDRNYWSSWETLNIGNIAKVNTGNNRYLFFEIKYTMTSPTAGKVTSFAVEYILNPNETYAPAVEDVTNMDNNHILPDGCNDLGGTTKTFKTIEITDAETLCGKSCDYYLWRPNHQGTQPISSVTGLQNILNNLTSGLNDSITNALNVDGSGSGVFYQKSGKNLIFKKINPGPGSYIIESDGIITIGVDASLSAKDPSINDLYNLFYQLDTNLSDVSIYIDYKFLQIDASLADLYAKDASSIKTGINLGGGIGEIFKGIAGQQIEFRTIVSTTGALTVQTVGDQVQIGFDASVSGETTWTDPDPVSADVGGINPGNDVSLGANAIELLEKILYEYFPPNITLNLNPSPGYYEKWVAAPEVSIYGSFNNDDFIKAKIYDASLFRNGLGDISLPPINYSDVSSGSFSWNDNYPPYGANWDDVTYTVKIYNKVNSINMQPAEASADIKFVNPYTWGVVSDTINAGNITPSILYGFMALGNKLITPKQTNEINFVRDPSMFKIKFVYAYDASYGDLSSIFDVKNDFNVTTSFDSTIINLTLGASPSPIPYKVYIKSHWIDVSSFKLIFNI